MNENLPYEKDLAGKLSEIQLPDENAAWTDMKHRLDEEDDRRPLPVWFKGCAVWGFLFLVIAAAGWWLLNKNKKGHPIENLSSNQEIRNTNSSDNNKTDSLGQYSSGNNGNKDSVSHKKKLNHETVTEEALIKNSKTNNPELTNNSENSRADIISVKKIVNRKKDDPQSKLITQKKKNAKKSQPGIDSLLKDNVQEQIKADTIPTQGILSENYDSSNISIKVNPSSDTSTIKKNDSLKTVKPVEAEKNSSGNKKDATVKKKFTVSVGIAVQQQIPIDSQRMVPYNSLGRKGLISDYIPSLYFRLNREDKWFLQTEFKYGAPQYSREFLYSQVNKNDTNQQGQTITTKTTKRLKKTFYHQLPITFNYFIAPGFSLGAGVVWNKFSSAVSDQKISRIIPGTQLDSLISQSLVRTNKPDSNFVSSYFQAVIETQYKYKRFSLGARYAFGLQPYIKFSLPGGIFQEEKNSSLQLFLRFELWRSGKKKE